MPIITTTLKNGRPRSREEIERTAQHEIEHLAQLENDRATLAVGYLGILGLTAAGAVAGNKMAGGKPAALKATATVIGVLAGYQLGYTAAPHERRARKAAKVRRQPN